MMPGMNGGRWVRGEIQTATLTQNSLKEDVSSFSTVATWWMRIEPLTGRESFLQQEINSDVTHKITLRYYDGLSPKHRIVYDNRNFDIQSVLGAEEGRNDYQIATAKEAL